MEAGAASVLSAMSGIGAFVGSLVQNLNFLIRSKRPAWDRSSGAQTAPAFRANAAARPGIRAGSNVKIDYFR
jgi:hypothetical protein